MDELKSYLYGYCISKCYFTDVKTKTIRFTTTDEVLIKKIKEGLVNSKTLNSRSSFEIKESTVHKLCKGYQIIIPNSYGKLFFSMGMKSSQEERVIQLQDDKEINRHIIRGYYDGKKFDSTKNFSNGIGISFFGTENNMYIVKNYIKKQIGINTVVISTRGNKNNFQISYHGDDCRNVIKWLYFESFYFDSRNYDFYKIMS